MEQHNLAGRFYTKTDIGKVRKDNEDFADARINAYGQIILIVADGMGGRNKGDYASRCIGNGLIKDFLDFDKPLLKPEALSKWLYKTINKYNREVYKKANSDDSFKGMGTTLTAVIIGGGFIVTAQVGDSRLYWVNEDLKLEQLTVDQTYVNYLKNNKKLTQSEISTHPERHKLTNAIGIRFNALVDLKTFDYHGERLFLCSDGLYNNVPFYDLQSILKGNESPERKCFQLIAFGNSNGGSDNMAVVVWETNK